MNEVTEFIHRRFPDDCNWTSGNCYYFAVILQARFGGEKLYYKTKKEIMQEYGFTISNINYSLTMGNLGCLRELKTGRLLWISYFTCKNCDDYMIESKNCKNCK